MFDWNKVCYSGKDMSGTKGQLLQVSHEELARHCTEGDLWTAVRGISQFIECYLVCAVPN